MRIGTCDSGTAIGGGFTLEGPPDGATVVSSVPNRDDATQWVITFDSPVTGTVTPVCAS